MAKKENQGDRIHRQQDKNNAFFGVGDTICITYPNGKKIKGSSWVIAFMFVVMLLLTH